MHNEYVSCLVPRALIAMAENVFLLTYLSLATVCNRDSSRKMVLGGQTVMELEKQPNR